MKTVTDDIIDKKALSLLHDLELLKLIKVHEPSSKQSTDWKRHKGAMTRQSIQEIEAQLNQLRAE